MIQKMSPFLSVHFRHRTSSLPDGHSSPGITTWGLMAGQANLQPDMPLLLPVLRQTTATLIIAGLKRKDANGFLLAADLHRWQFVKARRVIQASNGIGRDDHRRLRLFGQPFQAGCRVHGVPNDRVF